MLKQNGASQRKGVTGPCAREALHVSSTEAQAHGCTALYVLRPQQPGARTHHVHSTSPGAGQKRLRAREPAHLMGLQAPLPALLKNHHHQHNSSSERKHAFKVVKSGQSLDSGQSFMAWSSFYNKLNTESEKPQKH